MSQPLPLLLQQPQGRSSHTFAPWDGGEGGSLQAAAQGALGTQKCKCRAALWLAHASMAAWQSRFTFRARTKQRHLVVVLEWLDAFPGNALVVIYF